MIRNRLWVAPRASQPGGLKLFSTAVAGASLLHPRAGSPAEHLGWGARLYAVTRFAGYWLGIRSSLETDLFTRASWRLIQFLQLIKHDREVFIVSCKLANDSCELAIEFFVLFQQLSQLYEGTHNCDVDLNGSFAIKDTR